MVKHYIFDLDGTLYSNSPKLRNLNQKDFYNEFKPNYFLEHVMDNLDGNKYIFLVWGDVLKKMLWWR